jgi:hypothetical protein
MGRFSSAMPHGWGGRLLDRGATLLDALRALQHDDVSGRADPQEVGLAPADCGGQPYRGPNWLMAPASP